MNTENTDALAGGASSEAAAATGKLTLVDYYLLEGVIECVTGLHIGGSTNEIEIGGTDRPVIIHPTRHYPYIPGSSLKGKLRALLELRHAAFSASGGPATQQTGPTGFVARIFGISAGDRAVDQWPTALLVRDAAPTAAFHAELAASRQAGRLLLEQKTENSVNRINAKANPRTIERVPAGATFQFQAIFRVFSRDATSAQARTDFDHVLEALALLELDTLGGHGSRGYGQVQFAELTCRSLFSNEPVPLRTLASYLQPEQQPAQAASAVTANPD